MLFMSQNWDGFIYSYSERLETSALVCMICPSIFCIDPFLLFIDSIA